MREPRSTSDTQMTGTASRGPAGVIGKRTLTDGLVPPAATNGALLSQAAIARARRSNPIHHAQLHYDASMFGAGEDVGSEAFALAVARYQRDHGLTVDGMVGPSTA